MTLMRLLHDFKLTNWKAFNEASFNCKNWDRTHFLDSKYFENSQVRLMQIILDIIPLNEYVNK